jgi:aromatic amino acid aminotransferase I
VAPGSRLGWFTCSPLFAERLERQGETTTQAPCGFGQVRLATLSRGSLAFSRFIQSLVTQLLLTWKFDGYVRWLHGWLTVQSRPTLC